MKRLALNFFQSLPAGARWMLLLYAVVFPLVLAFHYSRIIELNAWLAIAPAAVWRGQVWRVISYAFSAGSPIEWFMGVLWLGTLAGLLTKHWSAARFVGYSIFCAVAAALPILLLRPRSEIGFVGNSGMIFGLLVAWDHLCRYERIVLLAIGEISVRQAVVLIAAIEVLVLLFCPGWFYLLAMMCGGLAGWLYLLLRGRTIMGQTSRATSSDRIVKLEL